MISMLPRRLAVASLAVVIMACNRPSRNSGTLTAVIDGVPFVSQSVAIVRANGAFQLNATGPNKQVITLQSADASAPRMVLFKPFLVTNYGAVLGDAGATWTSFANGGTGSMQFVTATSSRASGTFSFVAPALPASGATQTHTVTDGKFDVRF